MDNKQIEQFIRIYNTLLLVQTKGEDTILMGDTLKAFKTELDNLLKETEGATNTTDAVDE